MSIKNLEVVSDYISEEQSAGRLTELSVDEAAHLNIHCSPIGMESFLKRINQGSGITFLPLKMLMALKRDLQPVLHIRGHSS